MTHQKTAPRKVERRRRIAVALDMRIKGATYQQIGDALGVTLQSANRMVLAGVAEWNATIRRDAADLIALEYARLERLHAAVWDQAIAGDPAAVDRVLKIMERRAKLLGLDRQPDLGSETAELRIILEEDSNGWNWQTPAVMHLPASTSSKPHA
jgi:hypothetical protein